MKADGLRFWVRRPDPVVKPGDARAGNLSPQLP